MGAVIRRLFLDHPASVGESYPEHARFAAGFAFWLLAAGAAALVLFQSTASGILRRLHARIDGRGH